MNSVVFVCLYLLLMLPTYVLPYFGSNSLAFNALSAAVAASAGAGALGNLAFLAHLTALLALITVGRVRGIAVGKQALLTVLPVVAAVFDLFPILSAIPLVPTVLHVIALVLGATAKAPDGEAPKGIRTVLIQHGAASAVLLAVFVTWSGSAGHKVQASAEEQRHMVPQAAQVAQATRAATADTAARARREQEKTEWEQLGNAFKEDEAKAQRQREQDEAAMVAKEQARREAEAAEKVMFDALNGQITALTSADFNTKLKEVFTAVGKRDLTIARNFDPQAGTSAEAVRNLIELHFNAGGINGIQATQPYPFGVHIGEGPDRYLDGAFVEGRKTFANRRVSYFVSAGKTANTSVDRFRGGYLELSAYAEPKTDKVVWSMEWRLGSLTDYPAGYVPHVSGRPELVFN